MKLNKKIEKQISRHFIFVECPADIVGSEALKWQDASWWPKKCAFHFIRQNTGEMATGEQFKQEITVPLFPPFKGEVTKYVPQKQLERIYYNKYITITEHILVEERLNGTRVDCRLNIELRGLIASLFWNLIIGRVVKKNIEMILSALEKFALTKTENQKQL